MNDRPREWEHLSDGQRANCHLLHDGSWLLATDDGLRGKGPTQADALRSFIDKYEQRLKASEPRA